MALELTNGFGNVYLTIAYDAVNHWLYNNWIGYQTHNGILAGADACLGPLREHACAYLLNDNRLVIGPWDHAVEWIVSDWAPRAAQQGLTHFAHVVSPESMAAQSADAMHLGLGGRLQMRMFGDINSAQAWLREARQPVPAS
ncbi:STAS/SEC14 domain-containing protein [Hymenobacter sediminicola]|uniref:STAS/SEC14 domain-containing protein n=1 Tax=Hymenobacter sediminicola TaxID=2761579 RepID=A0A7G7WAZ6_9BACT|nr:STAS/SEC14 domain-containing protein [Hymenobacter sediminicola]QNH63539.1 STAS/SEC14 domain-containing protein [Hymenobacter sediminicola]